MELKVADIVYSETPNDTIEDIILLGSELRTQYSEVEDLEKLRTSYV